MKHRATQGFTLVELLAVIVIILVIAGWIVTEVGRQPWVIGGVLPTFLAVSSISAANVWMPVG